MSNLDRERVFPTNSRYEGTWNGAVNSMDGFGTYTYPDGSEYRGFFKNGHFQGYGTLKLRSPQPFTIHGTFDNGICTFVHRLQFGDGLNFEGTLNDDGTMDSHDWSYLTKQDRRFYIEQRYGIEPYGPNAYLTAQRKPRILPKGTFDVSYGVYYPRSGFVSAHEKTDHINKFHFLPCPKVRAGILKHCRCYRDEAHPRTSYKKFSHQIIACNIESVSKHNETGNCVCRFKFNCNRYFSTLCPEHFKGMASSPNASESDGQSSAFDITPSSSTVDSMGLEKEDLCSAETMQMSEFERQQILTQGAERADDKEEGAKVT